MAMAYTLKIDGEAIPRHADLLTNGGNIIECERDPRLRQHVHKLFSMDNTVGTVVPETSQLTCCLPQVQAPNLQ